MNVSTIESVIRMVLPVLAGLMFVITLVLALVGFGKWSRARLKAAVRKYGPFAVGFFIVWGALLADSQNVTQEEKEDAIEQEEEDEEENAVLGGLLLGSPRLMDFRGGLCGFESGGPEPAAAEEPVETWGLAAEAAPSVLAPTDSDYAAGLALTAIGTGETFDFTPPEGASVYEPWMRFGAARHWFRLGIGDWGLGNSEEEVTFPLGTNVVDALTVFSDGLLRLRTKDAGTFLAPLHADLCLAPAYWWDDLGEEASPSRFWSAQTPSGGMLFTWANALFGRNPTNAVSFQVEIAADGSVDFRYDLSRLDASDLTNLVVGVGSGNSGRVFTELQPGTTSLKWRRLDPMRADDPDPDGDGITTADEIVLYQTDPYNADTDRDGLSDYDEVNVAHSDPTDPHSVSPAYPDGFAVILGEENPFSYPEGSTNTVLEHIFYTGTTNAPFAYPVSSESIAVLEVTAYGVGSGELVIGDTVVPLLARPRPRLLMGANGMSEPTEVTLRVAVPKGTIQNCFLRIPESLEVAISSADFVYGVRPTFLHPRGWLAFPNTEASHPCIHDLNSRKVDVVLDPGFSAEGLACTWHSTDSVGVEVKGDLSATLNGRFPPRTTSPVVYTVSHPLYISGETNYTQTVRYCPRLDDDDLPDWYGHDGSDDEDDHEEYWCCFWGICCSSDGSCSCGCEGSCGYCGSTSEEGVTDDMDEVCPVHQMSYELCASLHDTDYAAARQLDENASVLRLHDPLEYDRVELLCPHGLPNCCGCPEHQTNYEAVARRSYRLKVADDSGADFSIAHEPCFVNIAGTRPSATIGDAVVSFVTNGAVSAEYAYTVLGMEIAKTSGPSLDTYNSLSRTLGLPMTINTNLDHAVQLTLRTNVRLPFGNVRFSLDDTEGQFSVWTYDYHGRRYRKILDSDGRSVINLSLPRWRALVGSSSGCDSETPIYITSSRKGATTMRFGYWGVSDGRIIEDWDFQTITSVNPPLVPDYNRDGKIDDDDIDDWLGGRQLYFWSNDDTWRGDDAFAGYSSGIHPTAYELPKNRLDMSVNGRNDLVNFCPLAVDVFALHRHLGFDAYVEFQTDDPGGVRFTAATTEWSEVGDMVKADQSTVYGEALHAAALRTTVRLDGGAESGYVLPTSLIRLGEDGAGIIAAEFASPGPRSLKIVIRKSGTDEILFTSGVDIQVLDVHDMYRWVNLFGACGEQTGSKFANRPYVSWPDSEHADANVVFVHGYNVHETEAWDWSQAMFKRLWWSGMDAGFTAVLWKGNHSQCWIPKIPGMKDDNSYATLNYHQNVLNAFRTAGAFKSAMDQLPGAKKYYIAHSLGNMLVSAARQDHGLEYEKYMMLNAAVPIEAYDPEGGVTVESKFSQTPPTWRAYPDRVRATHWYELFPEGDARRGFTWKNRFKDVDNTVNFYSSVDEVVANGDDSVDKLLSRDFAWYNQERMRGKLLVSASPQAGWDFSFNYRVTYPSGYSPIGGTIYSSRPYNATEAAAISSGDLKTRPFFLDFRDAEIYGEGGSEFVRTNDFVRWYALSHGIPAESFAAGANPVPKWEVMEDDDGDSKASSQSNSALARNINMATACNPEGEEADPVNWIHSYFIQRSLHDTKMLYEKMTKIINGNPIGDK